MSRTATQTNPSYDPSFEVPCTVAYEFITPQTAKELLEVNGQNRKLTKPAVEKLKGVVARKEWMYDSTDAIGLDEDGAVVNGQHRLHSIAASDSIEGVWCLVARGVRADIVQVIDQGMGRSLSQTLAMRGIPDPGGIAQAIEYLQLMISRTERHGTGANKPTVPQLLELLSEHPHLRDSLELAKDVHREYKRLNLGQWAAYHYVFSSVDGELADDFYTQLATGVDIGENDPTYLLRERLNKDNGVQVPALRLKAWQVATFLVTAWEATISETQLPARAFVKPPQARTQVPTVTGVDFLGTAVDDSPAPQEGEASEADE